MAYIKILAHFQKKYTFYFLFSFRSSSDNASSIQIGNCSAIVVNPILRFLFVKYLFLRYGTAGFVFSNVLKDKLIFWNIHQCR